MEIYFDNSATTKCTDGVRDIVIRTMTEDYGNPSSMHQKGVDAEKYVRRAREIIAHSLKASEKEIFFTSGGTESNNWAVIKAALANKRRGSHIITSKIEHPSVLNSMKYLETLGFEVEYIGVDSRGTILTDKLEQAVREDTILVSVMHVNNEIGTVQPIEKIARLVKNKNPQTLFHVDSVQGFGKFRIYPGRTGIDLLSVSGHKIHGPKGIGILYVKEKTKLLPLLLGGGQQSDMRSGTENVAGIAGIGQAVKEIYEDFDSKIEHMYDIRNRLIERLMQMKDVTLNGFSDRTAAPHIVSANFAGVRSEVLLHSLEEKGIYVSAGSACASNKQAASDTLTAIGLSKEQMEGTLRFSLCADNTTEEVDFCCQMLEEILPFRRKYSRY